MSTTIATMTAQHSAGIFANRNLDGPEIGTLVVVVDRAKNLPNLRTMGKQNPYCAARLGKMALKTETDQRGGQTPKWDQELRFNVHESLDYQKLKLSVFNEDKRTDLIGETFIELEDVFRRGGGQKDLWHELQSKGKYAGQIRIELTFYDQRPREEKASGPIEPRTSLSNNTSEPPSHMSGPRELASRRQQSHQIDDFEATADRQHIPLPRQGPRSFHTPPRVGSVADLRPDNPALQSTAIHAQPEANHSTLGAETGYREPLKEYQYPGHDMHSIQPPRRVEYDYPEVVEEPADDFGFSDDPYALEAAHVGDDIDFDQPQAAYTPYRHDRVQQLSGTGRARPLPHSQSAPEVYPHEPRSGSFEADDHGSLPSDLYNNPYGPPSRATREYSNQGARQSAPPPPTHRNSLPDPRRTPQASFSTSTPQRPLPQASHSDPYHKARTNQVTHPSEHYGEGHYAPQYAHEAPRRRSTNVYEGSQPHDNYDDRYYDDQVHHQMAPAPLSHPHYPQPPSFEPSHEPPYSLPHDQTPQHTSSGNGPQIVKPRAISPEAPQQRHAIRRKSINPSLNDGAVPFSPDSFDTYNPAVTSTSPNQRIQGAQARTSPLATQASSLSPNAEPESPIRDSRGKIVDPSDHLPASTHAPEPEKKGADKHRATITATVKTRFGPREARAAHIATTRTANYGSPAHTPSPFSSNPAPQTMSQSPGSSPSQQREAMAAAARQRMQTRGAGGSPLAPSAPGALNQGLPSVPRGGYSQQSPPPVPMKIPLDEYDRNGYGTEPYDALAQDMGHANLGQSPLQSLEARYGGNGGQRGRRARYGA